MICGTPLAAPSPEERRTVTILFADLVGFTERSDTADPEDVRRTLVPFHQRAKLAIERFGGTLDKFIGDAAMGVFGAPLAHEDDPERAVRAALELLDASSGEHPIRVAVNTGEAVVSMGSGPQVGEAVAGDVVNTASRMQSAAPPGGLVIGEVTWTTVRDRFDTEAMEPFSAKGKAEPIAIWRVLGERDERPVAPVAPLVGRARELTLIEDVVGRAAQLGRPQLVTVVAEPGIGKSRLIQELYERLAPTVTWLYGNCPPYGEANALAPLAQVVRALAGVNEGQDPATVERAIVDLVARLEPATSERAWLCRRLSLLADASSDVAQVPLDEVAAAVARVLSCAASEQSLVVTIEDLHWSEPVLRELLASIVDDADAPVVVLTTARPEIFDLDAGWGGGRGNTVTIELAPLTDAETQELIDSLLTASERRAYPEVLQNVGGNPLFAVEFVRMLNLEGSAEEVPISVQAVIGARLDSVGVDHRAIVQDAAVVGSRFWPEALAAVGERDPNEVRVALNELVRRGFLVRGTSSTLPGMTEYGFGHALIRDVAYARLPRLARAKKHGAAGTWLQGVAGDQTDRFAEPLANHFEHAVLLADEAGDDDEAARWRPAAAQALFTAGTVALRLDPSSALDRFERAMTVMGEEDERYPETLAWSALSGRRSGRLDHEEVLRRHLRTVELNHERGDVVAEATSRASAAGQLMALGRPEEARMQLTTAEKLIADQPGAAAELAHIRAWLAEEQMFAGNPRAAEDLADQALAGGGALEPVAIMALHIRGDSRIALGDGEGIEDLEEALRRAEALGAVSEIVTSHSYLADREWQVEGPAVALARLDEGSALADRRGAYSQGTWSKVSALQLLYELGRWDEVLSRSAPLAADGRMDVSLMVAIDLWTTAVYLRRGHDVGDLADLLQRATDVEELQVVAPGIALAALAAQASGDRDRAAALVEEFETTTRGKAAMYRSEWLPSMARLAVALGLDLVAEDLVTLVERATPRDELLIDTAAAVVAGDADAAAWAELERRWVDYGCPYERALAAIATGEAEAAERGRAILADLGVPT